MEKIHKLLQSPDDSDVEIGIQLLIRQTGRVFNKIVHIYSRKREVKGTVFGTRGSQILCERSSWHNNWLFEQIMKYVITYDFLFFKVYRPKKQQL